MVGYSSSSSMLSGESVLDFPFALKLVHGVRPASALETRMPLSSSSYPYLFSAVVYILHDQGGMWRIGDTCGRG
jgi:hypothetical protein